MDMRRGRIQNPGGRAKGLRKHLDFQQIPESLQLFATRSWNLQEDLFGKASTLQGDAKWKYLVGMFNALNTKTPKGSVLQPM